MRPGRYAHHVAPPYPMWPTRPEASDLVSLGANRGRTSDVEARGPDAEPLRVDRPSTVENGERFPKDNKPRASGERHLSGSFQRSTFAPVFCGEEGAFLDDFGRLSIAPQRVPIVRSEDRP
ncbi:hypothetical protein DTO164E3_1809 [Paecilomyces variotii]|nr:hypothetical protein DTO164E3_1809 [Paecilomyces variotii]